VASCAGALDRFSAPITITVTVDKRGQRAPEPGGSPYRRGRRFGTALRASPPTVLRHAGLHRPLPAIPDLTDVRGQALGRRAIEVAAAGRHHLLMIGPPGSGKTMLAERLEGLLPPLTSAEALTVARIHSAAGCALPDGELLERPPFRAPHHQASIVSLVGGGSWSLRPGEVSLATPSVLECP
jgi:predicted ATPase with chaperone activity